MRPDGSDVVRLTMNLAEDREPEWSPDGTRLAFESARDGGVGHVYVMNADGTGVTRLTFPDDVFSAARYPTWSPDGSQIAVVRWAYNRERIVVINATDGSLVTTLTTDDLSNYAHLDWSPDGSRILFSGDLDFTGYEIWSVSSSGGAPTKLSNSTGDNWYPKWSPDGGTIAFFSSREGGYTGAIYKMSPDGLTVTRLTYTGDRSQPAWSPDGKRIVVRTYVSTQAEIWSMNASDGSGTANLTNHPAQDTDPSWQATQGPVATTSPTPTMSPTPTATAIATPTPRPTVSQTPTPPPSQPAATSTTLRLRRHLIATGRVASTDPDCSVGAHVRIQRRRASSWTTVDRTFTQSDGTYRERLRDRAGKYRALADGTTECLGSASGSVRHTHSR